MRVELRHLQKMVAGVCMIVVPALWIVAVIVAPTASGKEARQLSATASHPDRQYVATLLFFAGAVLLAVAALGLVHLLHERRPGWGLLGGALTSLGVISVSSLFVGTSIMQVEMTKGRYDRDQMLSLLHFANNDARFAPFWILSIGLMLGLLVLAVGLYLDRAVPMASAGALAAAAVLLAIAFSASSRVLDIVAFAVLEAGLGSIGAIVLRETDAQWEETPRFEGFHPVMGSH